MRTQTLLSVGLFGRLSCLVTDRSTVLDLIAMNERLNHNYTRYIDNDEQAAPPLSAKASFLTGLPTLLDELNSLVEAIVLSDEILIFCGYAPRLVDSVTSRGYRGRMGTTHSSGFYQTIVWPDEANQLREVALSDIPVKLVTVDNERLLDAEIALEYPDRADTAVPVLDAIAKNGLDLRCLGSIDPEDLYYSNQMEMDAMAKILSFVDTHLGDEWVFYKDTVNPLPTWPNGLFKPMNRPYAANRMAQLKLCLYAELQAALQHGTLSVSSVHMGKFYPLLASQQNVIAGKLREFVSTQYSKQLHHNLSTHGIACLDLQLPPLLRFCLVDASSILDVLKKANAIRKERRFVTLRNYLRALSNETNPLKLSRALARLQSWIELDLRGLGHLPNGSIALTGNVSTSISLISLTRHLLAWNNPVVLVHSRLNTMLAGRDSIRDLARVLQVEPAFAAKAVAQSSPVTE